MKRDPRTDPTLARDVARHLDRRRGRGKPALLLLIAAAIGLAIAYLRCGDGLGLGGSGRDSATSGSQTSKVPLAAPATECSIRVTAKGLSVDGKPASREQVLETCQRTRRASVVVTGDARQGDWDELKAALESMAITVEVRSRLDSNDGPPK